MDTTKLKIISQESKSDVLQTDPYPELETGKCIWELSKGSRKGEPCNDRTFDGKIYCTKHQSLMDIKKADEKKTEVVVQREVTVIPLAPPPAPAPLPVAQPIAVPLPMLSSQPLLTIADMLAILQIFSHTVTEMSKALKN